MFTKVDYETYFSAIQNVDKKMLENVSKLIDEVSDAGTLRILNHVREDEKRHMVLCDELFSLLQENVYQSSV